MIAKVRPGQPLAIRAADWNAIAEAVAALARMQTGPGGLLGGAPASLVVIAKNSTGSALSAGGVATVAAAMLWRTVIQPGDMAGTGIVAKVLIADFR